MHKKIDNKRNDINKIIQQALSDKLGKSSMNIVHDINYPKIEVLKANEKSLIDKKRKQSSRLSRVANRNNKEEFTERPGTNFLTKVPGPITRLKLERGAFNGSIMELENKYLLVYRPHEYTFKACYLDKNFQVINAKHYPIELTVVADPRLIKTPDNKILLSYASFEANDYIAGNIIMDLNESENFILGDKLRISPPALHERQKNWMPFVYEDKLYFIASVNPHVIYEFDYKSGEPATKVFQTDWKSPWAIRRTLRGNTNAIQLPNGNYLTVFHTAMTKNGVVYYDNGAYIFEGKPPFRVLECSKKTILPADAANEPYVRKAGEIKCVFPMSLVLQGDKLIITYGDNDSAVKVITTNLEEVNQTMVPVV